jgi:hypothetical protein
MKPAIRIFFAPLFKRPKSFQAGGRHEGLYLHGEATVAPGRTIRLDPRSSMLLPTLVHEMTHVRHPSWNEKQVDEHTSRRMKKMSWKEKARLLQLLGRANIEGEE